MQKKILVIIPAYNEQDSIEKVVDEVNKYLQEADIVVVNDGSIDSTLNKARKKGAIVLDLPYNMGIGTAMQTGYLFAYKEGYDIAFQVDGDYQHDPKELKKVLLPILENETDMVIGSRYIGGVGFKSSITRRMGIKFFSWVLFILIRKKITDPTSGFRALNRKTIEFFAMEYPPDYPEVESLLLLHKKGFHFKEVSINMKERLNGESSINTSSAFYYMIKVTISMVIGCFRKIS
jgi:glycosyltransferase involved in cell wall biosynthesis